jgi:hypothetical protein
VTSSKIFSFSTSIYDIFGKNPKIFTILIKGKQLTLSLPYDPPEFEIQQGG